MRMILFKKKFDIFIVHSYVQCSLGLHPVVTIGFCSIGLYPVVTAGL